MYLIYIVILGVYDKIIPKLILEILLFKIPMYVISTADLVLATHHSFPTNKLN